MKCGYVLKLEEVQAIWDDISSVIQPSWLTSVLAQLGSTSHGKLKADQWWVLGTTFLPLSLIHLWQASDAENNNEQATRCAWILDVTLSLLSAVTIALSHTTTHSHADVMQQHLLNYLQDLKELFPDSSYSALFARVHQTIWPCSFLVGISIRTSNWNAPVHLDKL